MALALLIMDFQRGIVDSYPEDKCAVVLDRVGAALIGARAHGVPVIYVRLAFRADAPAINPRNALFARLAGRPEFNEDDDGTRIVSRLQSAPGEMVVVKKRASAFSGGDLAQITGSLGIDHLVLTGIATSGVVLSTVRDAADRDFKLTVLADACLDRDDEVHRVLCEKVFPLQATVSTVAQWLASL